MDEILMILLECGNLDLQILDNVGYDLGEITEELRACGINPTLNAITREIFIKGQKELIDAVNDAIKELKELQEDIDLETDKGEIRFNRLREEIKELESLDPEADMKWYCNCIDTLCWFANNEEIYRKYIPEAIKRIEDNMGFKF